MITEGKQTDQDTTDEHHGMKRNNSNIVVKIGARDNNIKSPNKCIDSCEETQITPEKQRIFTDDSSSSEDNLIRSIVSFQKEKGATNENKKGNAVGNIGKAGTQNKRTPTKRKSRKRKSTEPAKQKLTVRKSKGSKKVQ